MVLPRLDHDHHRVLHIPPICKVVVSQCFAVSSPTDWYAQCTFRQRQCTQPIASATLECACREGVGGHVRILIPHALQGLIPAPPLVQLKQLIYCRVKDL